MLTEKELNGVKAILDKLTAEDLYSLTFTVTKGYIKPENKAEAVQAILLYCEKPSLLLRRKKVKKEIIFNYLRDMGIVVAVNGEKSDYVKACLQFWESLEKVQIEYLDDFMDETIPVPDYNSSNYFKDAPEEPQPTNVYDTFTNLDPTEVVNMGQAFVFWFYNQLKGHSFSVKSNEIFMEDCTLTWCVKDMERIFNGAVHSASEAVQVISEMITSNMLLLEPGVEGVFSSYDPHGIVKVGVGGVVHRMNNSVGMFEQVFGLFRDPFENGSWKVKRTDLKMQVNISLSQPVHTDQYQNVLTF